MSDDLNTRIDKMVALDKRLTAIEDIEDRHAGDSFRDAIPIHGLVDVKLLLRKRLTDMAAELNRECLLILMEGWGDGEAVRE